MVLQSRRVWLAGQFVPAQLEVADGKIVNVYPFGTKTADVDYGNKRIVPGFIDVHTHGAYGFDTNDGEPEGLRNRVRFFRYLSMRRKDREVTNIIEILQIIEKAKVLHLALFDADYPYIVPLHYGYEYTEGILIFYMHCAKEGHKLDLIRSNPNVCIEVESDVELISGGDVACKYGASFASVIGRGRAELTEDVQEKIRGLSLFMKNQTGREFNINEEMASTVEVIKVVISEFTAKSRSKA